MRELEELNKISKLLNRVAFSLFIFFWGEIIFMVTKFKTPGQLLYDEYGVNGISIYFLIIFIFMFILFRQSTRISVEVKKINEKQNRMHNNGYK